MNNGLHANSYYTRVDVKHVIEIENQNRTSCRYNIRKPIDRKKNKALWGTHNENIFLLLLTDLSYFRTS